MSSSAQALTLHVWPSKWGVPSIEPSCIAAAFYLQLALPGRFSIQECTNPDASPSGRSVSAETAPPFALKLFFIGQLPYLTHGHHSVAPLSSIVKYVAALAPASVHPVVEADAPEPMFSADVDVLLDSSERAQRTAWTAHIEAVLGDLVVRCHHLPYIRSVVTCGYHRPMPSTPYPRTMPQSRNPLYLPFTAPHNHITYLAASARRTRLALGPPDCGLTPRRSLRTRSRSVLGRKRKTRTTRIKRLEMHSSASGWVTRVLRAQPG